MRQQFGIPEMASDLKHGFGLGSWKIEPLRGAVSGPRAETHHLEPKVMDVLVCLAEHANELVTRDQLLDAVWRGQVAADELLTRAISELRHALHDDPGDPKYIETVPKRGYRLIGQVRLLGSTGPERKQARAVTISKFKEHKLAFVIVAAVALALVYFAYDEYGIDPAREEAPAFTSTQIEDINGSNRWQMSVAVLPFVNMSDDPGNEYFSDGLSEEILILLSRVPGLKVIARTSSFSFKGKNEDLRVIGEILGVKTVLEGSVRRSGDLVRITAQLVDVSDGTHIWAESYDHKLTAENLFAIQSDISKAIAESLQATLSPEQERRINAMPTDNLLAYDAYLRGRQLMATRESEDLQLATRAFGKAVELDPQFAMAWVGVADSHELLSIYGSLSAKDAKPVIEDAINQALMIDDTLGEAYTSLGSLLEDSDWSGAETAYQRAIELSPNYATAYHWYSVSLARYQLRIDERIDLALEASELDPRSLIIGLELGDAYMGRGLYSMAEHQYLKVHELDPDFVPAYNCLADLYAFSLGRYQQALINARKGYELDPGNLNELVTLVFIYLELGDMAAAQSVRKRMADFDANHFSVDVADTLINITNKNRTGTNEAINRLLPKIKHVDHLEHFIGRLSLGKLSLTQGDTARSREIFLSVNPGWLDPSQWQGLAERHKKDSCVVSWLLMNTGDEDLGAELLQQTTTFLAETLPAAMEHVDGEYSPEICHLTAGDTEKALQSIETQLAHNHLWGWQIWHQLPMYDLIRQEPRYLAVIAERERRIAQQREAITRMDERTGQ